MIQTHLPHTHDFLVAASIARNCGFTETEAALTELARSAVCVHVPRCPDGDCTQHRNERLPQNTRPWDLAVQ